MLNISISGINPAQTVLKTFSEEIKEGIQNGVLAGAELVCSEAKVSCPVRTGALRDSVSVSSSGNTAIISAQKDYAVFVEFGTSKMSPQPFMVPALLNNTDKVIGIISSEVEEI